MEEAPRREKGLPILYNEYCAAWGSPSEEKVAAMVEALRGKPISYFVIDAGWYKPEDKAWGTGFPPRPCGSSFPS